MLWGHKTGFPDRLRSGDLLLEKQACWLDYTTGTKIGEGKRIYTFDLMHVTHPLWLAELYPRKWWGRRVLPSLPLACQTSALLMSYAPEMERVNGVAPSSQPWHGRILLLNHTRKNWCPQPDSHRQPDA